MKNKITSNILEDISKRLKGESYSESCDNALIVFNGSTIGLDKSIENIKELKKSGMKLSVAFSFMGEQLVDEEKITKLLSPINVYKEEDIFKLKAIIKNYSMVIGPNITMNTLSKISLGMIDSFVSNIIWTFLYQGKNTYLDFSSVREYFGEETKNQEIKDMIERYINSLKRMGVVEINEDNYLEEIIIKQESIKVNLNNTINKNITISQEYKKVITERDINNFDPNNKNLVLPKGTIITPLARDRAREKHIKIEIK